MLEQAVEQVPDGPRLVGRVVGILNLAEDLWFTQHQGVEPAGDPKDVLYRLVIEMSVNIGFQLFRAEGVIGPEPGKHLGTVRFGQVTIQFGPVAGGNNGRFVHRGQSQQVL